MTIEIGINASRIVFTLNLILSHESIISKKINTIADTIPTDMEAKLNPTKRKLGKSKISSKQNTNTGL